MIPTQVFSVQMAVFNILVDLFHMDVNMILARYSSMPSFKGLDSPSVGRDQLVLDFGTKGPRVRDQIVPGL